MKYCYNCGKEVDEKAVICVGCGADLVKGEHLRKDAPSFGLATLCFFIPLLGLILYFVYNDISPKKAKSCGKGALIGFCVSLILTIIFFIVYFLVLAALMGSTLF